MFGNKFFQDSSTNKILKIILVFSILFLPLGLVSGSFIINFLSFLVILSFIILIIKNQTTYTWEHNIIYYLLTFILYLLVNSLFAENIIHSLKKSIPYSLSILIPISIFYICREYHNIYKYFFYFMTAALAVVCLYGYFEYFFRMDIFLNPFSPYRDPHRLGMIFSGEQIVGSFIARLIPLYFALTLIVFSKSERFPKFYFLFIIICEVLVFLSGERTSMFILLLSNLLFILLAKKWRTARIIMLSSIIFITSIFVIFDDRVKQRIINHTFHQIGFDTNEINLFSQTHEKYFITSIELFKEKPLIGHGVNSYRLKCNDVETFENENCSTHPHNYYFQLLAETGLIGFSFLISIFFYISYMLARHFLGLFSKKSFLSDVQVCILAGFFSVLWPVLPTNNFFSSWITIIHLIPLGFLMASFVGENRLNLSKNYVES